MGNAIGCKSAKGWQRAIADNRHVWAYQPDVEVLVVADATMAHGAFVPLDHLLAKGILGDGLVPTMAAGDGWPSFPDVPPSDRLGRWLSLHAFMEPTLANLTAAFVIRHVNDLYRVVDPSLAGAEPSGNVVCSIHGADVVDVVEDAIDLGIGDTTGITGDVVRALTSDELDDVAREAAGLMRDELSRNRTLADEMVTAETNAILDAVRRHYGT